MRYTGGVLLEAAELRIAAALADIAVRHLERTDGGVQPAARELRDQLRGFAAGIRAGTLASRDAGQGFPPESGIGDIALIVPGSPPMTVRDVSGLLGITEQAVRARCRSGSLTAVRTRGGWEIDADSAAAMAARRKGAG